MRDEFLWVEKYRPHKLADCILPERLRETFQSFLDRKEIPNLILSGSPGLGKSSVALALLDELDVDWLKINAAKNRGIDVVRTDIEQFSTTVSLKEGRKYIVLDEADGMTKEAQESLKGFIEEFSANVGFIFTANNSNKIIDPIHSRCTVIDFDFSNPADFGSLGQGFFNAAKTILEKEHIVYDKKVLAKIIQKFFPDFRRTLNELQTYGMKGPIDSGILGLNKDLALEPLLGFLKGKEWKKMREWVGENSYLTNDFPSFAKKLYKLIEGQVSTTTCLAEFILKQADYDFKNYFVMDRETNLVSFLTEVMSILTFK